MAVPPVGADDGLMREFLVTITTTIPEDTEPDEIARRRAAEAARAKELAATGHLVRLWRPADGGSTVGLWRAADHADLYANVLNTLPMRSWMFFAVVEVRPHPNDPGA